MRCELGVKDCRIIRCERFSPEFSLRAILRTQRDLPLFVRLSFRCLAGLEAWGCLRKTERVGSKLTKESVVTVLFRAPL